MVPKKEKVICRQLKDIAGWTTSRFSLIDLPIVPARQEVFLFFLKSAGAWRKGAQSSSQMPRSLATRHQLFSRQMGH